MKSQQEEKKLFDNLVEFVDKSLKKDIDYGVIKGMKKNTAYAPGVYRVAHHYGFNIEHELVESEKDFTGKDHDGEPFFHFAHKAIVKYGGEIVSSAMGTCNSWEDKYRYRNGRVCPKCQKLNIRLSKDKSGWYCWKATDGCGATFQKDDQTIGPEISGPNKKIANEVNTIMKMSQKRSTEAAVLLATCLATVLATLDKPAPQYGGQNSGPAKTPQPTKTAPRAGTINELKSAFIAGAEKYKGKNVPDGLRVIIVGMIDKAFKGHKDDANAFCKATTEYVSFEKLPDEALLFVREWLVPNAKGEPGQVALDDINKIMIAVRRMP